MSGGVALFGGSFDPIHHGHLIVARAVVETLGIDRLIFLPSARPPHKPDHVLAEPVHRTRMIELAIEGETHFEISDFDLARDGPSYTFDTVSHFRGVAGSNVELCWIVGADSLAELPSWHRADELVEACRIVTAVRPGSTEVDWTQLGTSFGDGGIDRLRRGVIQTPAVEISATDIRRRIAEGRSIRYLVPESVRGYIERHGLYRGRRCGTGGDGG